MEVIHEEVVVEVVWCVESRSLVIIETMKGVIVFEAALNNYTPIWVIDHRQGALLSMV